MIWRGKEEGPMTELPHNIPLLRVEHPLDPVVHFPAPARVLGLPVDITKVSQPSQPGAYYPVGRRMSIGMCHRVCKLHLSSVFVYRIDS